MLVDGAFFGRNVVCTFQYFIHIAVILDENTPFLVFRQIHVFDDVSPPGAFLPLVEIGDAADVGIFIRILLCHHFQKTEGHLEALYAGIVGVPVVVHIVFVFIRAGNPQYDIFLFGLGEGYPLAPETADGNHYFQAILGDIVHIARQSCMLNNGIDNDIVTVDFLEGYFPFAVAFLSIVGYLRKQRCTVLETQFAGVFYGLGKLVVPVCQQVLCNLFGSGEQKKRYTTQFRVPISVAAIFFSGESFGADVQARVISPVSLIQLEYVVPDTLLRFRVPFDDDIRFVPDFLPGPSMLFYQRIPAYALGFACLSHGVLHQFTPFVVERRSDGGVFDECHVVSGFHVGTYAETGLLFLFYPYGVGSGFLVVFEELVSHGVAYLCIFPAGLCPEIGTAAGRTGTQDVPYFQVWKVGIVYYISVKDGHE